MNLTQLDFSKLRTDEKYIKQYLTHDLLEQFTTKLGNIKVSRNIEGKVSSTATMSTLAGTLDMSILKFLYETNRGDFYPKNLTQTKEPTLAKLTPIAMYALKRDQGIMYEEWDKEDTNIRAFLGKDLEFLYKHGLNVGDYDPMEIRQYYVNSVGAKIDSWPRKVMYTDGRLDKIPAIILGQLWIAYSAHRQESMILDINNWDNMPESLDVVAPKTDPFKGFDTRNNSDNSGGLPWE